MLTIQQAGQQILQNNPGKFYIFGGTEYGVKCKYLDALKEYYNGVCTEVPDFASVFDLMRTKQLIPLIPQVYVVRYDESFLSGLKERTASEIAALKIAGTIVGIYQDSKAVSKCDKFLPDYTVTFDSVASVFVQRYLIEDYPQLDRRLVEFSMKSRTDYMGAKILCGLLNTVERSATDKYDNSDLESMFYGPNTSMEDHIKVGFAARNFPYLIKVLEIYPGELDTLFYTMLNALVELDKLKVRSYMDSSIKQYLGLWTKPDIYNMYCFVFKALEDLRSVSSDTYGQIVYLFGLLQYQRIPPIDSMEWAEA